MGFPVDVNVLGPKSLVKDENCWIIDTNNLFLMAKSWVEPAKLFGWADNRKMVPQYATDSSEQHSSCFRFKVFLFF